jgi:hypothetical protein
MKHKIFVFASMLITSLFAQHTDKPGYDDFIVKVDVGQDARECKRVIQQVQVFWGNIVNRMLVYYKFLEGQPLLS